MAAVAVETVGSIPKHGILISTKILQEIAIVRGNLKDERVVVKVKSGEITELVKDLACESQEEDVLEK